MDTFDTTPTDDDHAWAAERLAMLGRFRSQVNVVATHLFDLVENLTSAVDAAQAARIAQARALVAALRQATDEHLTDPDPHGHDRAATPPDEPEPPLGGYAGGEDGVA